MATMHVNTEIAKWMPGSPVYGADAIYQGEELVHLKHLSDRRADGVGVAYLVRFLPPTGKAIKIIAVARSDEHVFNLKGDQRTKSGRKLRFSGDYAFNPTGQPHGALVSVETLALVVYAGEPDEIKSISVVDIQ